VNESAWKKQLKELKKSLPQSLSWTSGADLALDELSTDAALGGVGLQLLNEEGSAVPKAHGVGIRLKVYRSHTASAKKKKKDQKKAIFALGAGVPDSIGEEVPGPI